MLLRLGIVIDARLRESLRLPKADHVSSAFEEMS
jgi:hypothetical protein